MARAPRAPTAAATSGAPTRRAAARISSPRRRLVLINDPVRSYALFQPGPDLARRAPLPHLGRDEPAHVQAVIGVVVVEHAQAAGQDQVVRPAQPIVDGAHALAV